MADTILKDTNGKIWVNSEGKVYKQRKFSESVLQSGLTFWGAADPTYLTLVDGLVSEAYDIRGTGQKMIQNIVARRPVFSIQGLLCNTDRSGLVSNVTYAYKSVFIVMNTGIVANGPVYGFGIGTQGDGGKGINNGLGRSRYSGTIVANSTGFPKDGHYVNNVRYSSYGVPVNGIGIYHSSLVDIAANIAFTVGNTSSDASVITGYIIEWGVYNRVLTEMEVIYNINALNTKYSIF